MMRSRLFALVLASAVFGQAEKLPLKIYTAADGLAHNSVNRIVRDSRGYLWFCTIEGLSRFDGYEFHNYTRRDGLPHRDVRDLIETRSGDFWVATGAGACRFRPAAANGAGKFQVYRVQGDQQASYINALLEDSLGRIWCGTKAGLFRLDPVSRQAEGALKHVDIGMPAETSADLVISALLEDGRGDIWIGAGSGLYRLRHDGKVERYSVNDGFPDNFITTLIEDQEKRIWAGTSLGLCKLVSNPTPGRRAVERVFKETDGLGADYIRGLHQLRDGTICVGTTQGLSVMRPGSAERRSFRTYTTLNGLSGLVGDGLAEDSAGNLWIGLDDGGTAKLTWKTFLTYTDADGLRGTQVDSIFENKQGTLCVLSRRGSEELFLNELDGNLFRAVKLNLPPEPLLLDWGARNQSVVQDHEGNWWVGTGKGLMRFDNISGIQELGKRRPQPVHTGPESIYGSMVFSVFEDSGGDMWVSTTGKRNGLARLDRNRRVFEHYSETDGLPSLTSGGVSLFSTDKAGDIWMGRFGFLQGQPGLVRLRGHRFQQFAGGSETQGGGIRALYLDSKSRLWVGTSQNGLMRFDDPSADKPRFTSYTTASGLSSDIVLSLTEDKRGRIYIGSGGGVDRLDVETGHTKRYTSADGLVSGEIHAAYCDHLGRLWFGTSAGLSRLDPGGERPPAAPPPIFISSLRVAGVGQPIAEAGQTELSGLRYQPNQNDIQLDFVGLDFAPGERLRYQYILEGADSEWSPASLQRSVNYANLSHGSYRFVVRALNSEGVASARPASVSFVILPPVWLRWWFLLLAAAAVSASIYWLHHYRVTRLLELERVRTRIATDLHDDVGSSLSQIAILSEVANRHVDVSNASLAEPLTDIAGISRDLVDSMSDIVWAIDPERDHLGDLVHRMRRFASDVFSPREIRLAFQTPAGEQNLQMGADQRRQIFLIFKEAVHNVLRHSGATEVSIDFQVEHGWLNLRVADNGKGFDVVRNYDGHGLRSMRERAESLGGGIETTSSPGNTALALRVPVGRRSVQRARTPHE